MEVHVYSGSDKDDFNALKWLMTNRHSHLLKVLCQKIIKQKMMQEGLNIKCYFDLFGGKFVVKYDVQNVS